MPVPTPEPTPGPLEGISYTNLLFINPLNVWSDSDDLESEEEDPGDNHPIPEGSHGPQEFIWVIPHPHSERSPFDIALDHQSSPQLSQTRPTVGIPDSQPWAPFRTHADFEFSRLAVSKALDRETIETVLEGFNGQWAHTTDLTIKNYKDYQSSLSAARKFGVQVSTYLLCMFSILMENVKVPGRKSRS